MFDLNLIINFTKEVPKREDFLISRHYMLLIYATADYLSVNLYAVNYFPSVGNTFSRILC